MYTCGRARPISQNSDCNYIYIYIYNNSFIHIISYNLHTYRFDHFGGFIMLCPSACCGQKLWVKSHVPSEKTPTR